MNRFRAALVMDDVSENLWWPVVFREKEILVISETETAWMGDNPLPLQDAAIEAKASKARLESERINT